MLLLLTTAILAITLTSVAIDTDVSVLPLTLTPNVVPFMNISTKAIVDLHIRGKYRFYVLYVVCFASNW